MTWTPGHRRVPPGVKKFADTVGASANIDNMRILVYRNSLPYKAGQPSDLEDDTPVEPGDNIVLTFVRLNKSFSINMSDFNTEEFNAFVEVIQNAILAAVPIVTDRDRAAQEAADAGHDVFYRRHRGTPKVSIFPRLLGQNNSGVQHGPENVLAGDEAGQVESGRPGDERGAVAEQPTPVSQSEDNGPQTHDDAKPGVS